MVGELDVLDEVVVGASDGALVPRPVEYAIAVGRYAALVRRLVVVRVDVVLVRGLEGDAALGEAAEGLVVLERHAQLVVLGHVLVVVRATLAQMRDGAFDALALFGQAKVEIAQPEDRVEVLRAVYNRCCRCRRASAGAAVVGRRFCTATRRGAAAKSLGQADVADGRLVVGDALLDVALAGLEVRANEAHERAEELKGDEQRRLGPHRRLHRPQVHIVRLDHRAEPDELALDEEHGADRAVIERGQLHVRRSDVLLQADLPLFTATRKSNHLIIY